MPTCDKAGGDVHDLIDELVRMHYPARVEAEARVGAILARAATDDDGVRLGPAVKLHGYPCAGT